MPVRSVDRLRVLERAVAGAQARQALARDVQGGLRRHPLEVGDLDGPRVAAQAPAHEGTAEDDDGRRLQQPSPRGSPSMSSHDASSGTHAHRGPMAPAAMKKAAIAASAHPPPKAASVDPPAEACRRANSGPSALMVRIRPHGIGASGVASEIRMPRTATSATSVALIGGWSNCSHASEAVAARNRPKRRRRRAARSPGPRPGSGRWRRSAGSSTRGRPACPRPGRDSTRRVAADLLHRPEDRPGSARIRAARGSDRSRSRRRAPRRGPTSTGHSSHPHQDPGAARVGVARDVRQGLADGGEQGPAHPVRHVLQRVAAPRRRRGRPPSARR